MRWPALCESDRIETITDTSKGLVECSRNRSDDRAVHPGVTAALALGVALISTIGMFVTGNGRHVETTRRGVETWT